MIANAQLFSSISTKCTDSGLEIHVADPCVGDSDKQLMTANGEELCDLESKPLDFNARVYHLSFESSW